MKTIKVSFDMHLNEGDFTIEGEYYPSLGSTDYLNPPDDPDLAVTAIKRITPNGFVEANEAFYDYLLDRYIEEMIEKAGETAADKKHKGCQDESGDN
jgi:hypothetical protein